MAPKRERKPIRLTKAEVENLAIEEGAYFVPVVNARGQSIQGLNVRVLPSGLKVWVHRYRFDGFQKSTALGRWPAMTCDAAEKKSKAVQVEINAKKDPNQAKADAKKAAQEARLSAVTVTDLVNRYILEHVPSNSPGWGKEATRLLKLHVLPVLGDMPLAAVGPADISALLFEMKQTTPVQANRTRAVLRTMFGRAEEWELRPLGSNPVAVVKQRAPETKRDRRLSDLELKSLGLVLQGSKEDPALLLAVRLALLAGMRKGEIQKLRWEWVDLEAGEIRIPADSHKTGKKIGRARVVYLCDALTAYLKDLPQTIGCPYVIPGKPKVVEKKTVWAPIWSLQSPWERIRVAAKLATKGEPKEEDPGLHDLRRTFASVGADLGLKGFVGELLGHAEATVTDIYTRTAAQALHDATEKIGTRIEGILTGKIDPVKESEERRKAKVLKAGS